jgi:VASt domain-containing protein/GRAM domain-containing protein
METVNGSNVAAVEASARKDDNAAAQAVSKAYTPDKINGDKSTPELSRNSTVLEDTTPIKQSIEPEATSIRRTGSVRSKLSNGRRRRTRGSSATASLAPPVNVPSRFSFASAKRNKDFHSLFKSVPEDDLLIEDYAAALQREILLQGRIYISEGHICFWSNIFGYVTTLVMSFDEVISVEKKSTAMIFQNAIAVQTMHARNVFASLLTRDTTYDLIISIWRNSHPNLRSSLNGAPVEGTATGDKTEKAASVADDDSASEEIYDEDLEEDDDEDSSYTEARDGSVAGSDVPELKPIANRKVSAQVAAATGAVKDAKAIETTGSASAGSAAVVDFPGPATHEPTDCGDAGSHCEKPLHEATIPAPLGKVYSLMFGPKSGTFMGRFLLEDEKCWDLLQLEEGNVGLGSECKSRTFNYMKPLMGSIGPKQTKCIVTENLEQFDLEKAVSILCSTQTPDVPSGNSFLVKTRYCLMWAPGNGTKLIMTYAVEWSSKSWLKGTSVHIFTLKERQYQDRNAN